MQDYTLLIENAAKAYQAMWEGKSERPICGVVLYDDITPQPEYSVPLLSQQTCNDLTISPKEIVERYDLELQRRTFLGDAYPNINMDCFGPGVVAAFLGAELDNTTGNVWFHPKKELPLNELHFEYTEDNVWFRRIMEIYEAAAEKWNGSVVMGIPDLGGIIDILSTFRPGESLMFDLYDEPEEVERLVGEIHTVWHQYYQKILTLLRQSSPYHTDWSGMLSDKTSYVIQADFTYMIGPDMFNQFVLPELTKTVSVLERTLYHLDGPGEIAHLDSLLSIEELDGVQWIPGAGNPEGFDSYWDNVYNKIQEKGKFIQLGFASIDGMKQLFQRFEPKRIVSPTIWLPKSQEREALQGLRDIGCV